MMWRAGVILACLVIAAAAAAEPAPQKKAEAAPKAKAEPAAAKAKTPPAPPKKGPKDAPKAEKKSPAPPKPNPLTESYAALPLPLRVSIQADLLIVGDYEGPLNGEFGDDAINAVKAFQKRKGYKETGVLNPVERVELANAAKPRQTQRGWQIIEDAVTGVRVFVPTRMMPQVSQIANGSRWASARGEMAIETFRIAQPGTTLAAVFADMKKGPVGRRVSESSIDGNSFEISGLQNLKNFQVHGTVKGDEVRGVTILYDQALEGTMPAIATAVSNAFVAFPTGVAVPVAKSKVEYASGIAVSGDGHIITDYAALEGCHIITLGGLGGVDRVAEDKDKGLLLLRVYGARALRPMALAGETAKTGDVTLLGIAEPQAQDGGAAVSAVRARLADARLDPAPGPGFTGGAVLDPQGRLAGMVTLKPALVAGTGGAPPAALLGVETIRNFLDARNVRPASAAVAVTGDAATASIVRVICVRK